tara:strand:- start:545 stop:1270 length:726 start_codon:yes stop_codon:yes gene_type:complete
MALIEQLTGACERHGFLRSGTGWLCVALSLVALPVLAHNVSATDATYIEGVQGVAVGPFMYLGAKHMVTGFDHLLYLVGVVFFLARPRDVVLYVTLFTLGHSLTLIVGVLSGLTVNPWVIDAIIGFSIVYKAFENMGGFERLGISIDTRAAVFVFGLCHGMGLATKLAGFSLDEDGLVANILSFNVGVEVGQIVALAFILLLLLRWRQSEAFSRHAFAANTVLMTGGFLLVGYQLAGYATS